jgi:hypothetical protein
LPGEVDPQLFLQWLDDQTSTTAPPTSYHPMSSWATGGQQPQPSFMPEAQAHRNQQQNLKHGRHAHPLHSPAEPMAASPHGETERSLAASPTSLSRTSQPSESSASLGQTHNHSSHHPPIPVQSPAHRFPQQTIAGDGISDQLARQSNADLGQQDLLTTAWLDDALTHLAATGLDMPFL